ncbi:MAG: radical SAM protein [Candidatus Omnitrophota bacterium]
MNIILVNLPWKKRASWGVRAGSRWPHIKDHTEENYLPFPFFLAYAAALLKKNGFQVEIIDAIAEKLSYRDFIQKVKSLKPELLVAEISTVSLTHDLKILGSFDKKFSIAICGPEIQLTEERFLAETENVDYLMYGEYEATLLELAKHLNDHQNLKNVKGLIYRDNHRIRKNPPRELVQNLDELPWPLREQLPIKRYNDSPGDIPIPCASMWASRGCPFKCSFCLWPQVMYSGNSYRVRDVVDVVNEMQYLVKELGFKSIYFDDDTWNVGRERMLAFCAELEKRGLIIPWAIMARAELMDEELLERMNSVGLFSVKYGVESASQELLNNIQKGTNLEKVEKIVKYTKYLGIKTHLTFTFGLPGETKQTIQKTIEYAKKLNPTSVQFSLATPFPGTRFFAEMDKKGLILTKNWDKFDGNHESVIKTDYLSAKDLQKAKKDAYAAWDKHCQMRYKNLFAENLLPVPTLKEKFIVSLRKYGMVKTGLKIMRFLIRKFLLVPVKIKQFIIKKMWIIEDTLCAGDLKLSFGEGRIKLYWQNQEITKDVGLTTSLHYGERWIDSSQASWKLEKYNENKIRIKLKWDNVPIRQEYLIEINDNQEISWSIDMQIAKQVQIFEYKAGIMLDAVYNMWKDDLGTGKFPPIKDWEEIELYNTNSQKIIALRIKDDKQYLFPDVELQLNGGIVDKIYPQIQNTDKKTDAHLLQMRRFKIARFEPGDYHCFNLKIKVKKEKLIKQNISQYKQKVPLAFLREQISQNGLAKVLGKITKNLYPKKLNEYYGDIIGVLDGSYAYRGPYCVQIDLTNDCNSNCMGCWCNSPLLKDKKIMANVKKQTLPIAIVKQTIDQLAKMGTKEIYFAGGGEPFMHPDILKILEHVKCRGLRCYVNTNFTLIDSAIAKRLAELKIDNLVVSVWAGTAQTYFKTHPNKSPEMFYQIKGVLQFLNLIKKNNPQINIYNVISNLNYEELEKMVEFAIKTNCDSVEFTVIDTIPDATDELMLTDEQREFVYQSCLKIKERLEGEWKGKIKILQFEQFIRRIHTDDAKDANYDKDILAQMPCYIGWLFTRILADGNVNFCLKAHRIPVGNIYAHDFLTIWNSQKQREFRKRALFAPRDDVFFSFIGNDPEAKIGCFKSCDDLARNIHMHKRIQSLTGIELRVLKLILLCKKIQRGLKTKIFKEDIKNKLIKAKANKEIAIFQNDLKVVFHIEGVKFYWKDIEITQSVGLSTSVCIFGLWYDSSKADWKVIKHNNQEIILKNVWRKIPIAQQWHIEFDSNSTLKWRVNMSVDSRIEIEQTKASIMLSPAYKKWLIDKQKGRFPHTMNWQETLIEKSSFKKIAVEKTKLKGNVLPQICLNYSDSEMEFYPQVQNSDSIINARIISAKCEQPNTGKVFLPGEYQFFSSKMEINSEQS